MPANDPFKFLLAIVLAFPMLGAALSPLAYRFMRKGAILFPLISALIPFLAILHILKNLSRTPRYLAWPWVEDLPLRFSFVLDGFGGLFALMVAGVGVLVVWYAHFYMKEEEGTGRFFSHLLLFMGSMLGVALSDHFLTTFLFWEATSVSSFLLIGFWHEKEASREGALKALFITSIGGLFLLAGMALLGTKTGVWTWGELATIDPTLIEEPWMTSCFFLMLIGVFTKSAQVPFHIWLPDAMEAPTPVSAFLHSATMVKAGVFLLFRLYPLFHLSPFWTPTLVSVGMATMLLGAVLSLKQRDLKAILAYSTISQLGLFVALHGYSGMAAPFADALRAGFIFHIFVHASYKGALFLLTGIVDHATHTRDISKLGSLWGSMPRVAFFFLLSAASMAGLPPFLGFISKEAVLDVMIKAALLGGWGWIPLGVLVGSAAITVAVALKLSIGIGFLKPSDPLHLRSHPPHDAPWAFLLSPALLALGGLVCGVVPSLLVNRLYPVALIGQGPGASLPSFALWHGVNAPLLVSLGIVLAGLSLFRFRKPAQAFQEAVRSRWTFHSLYTAFWDLSLGACKKATLVIQNGSLTRYMAILIGFLALLATSAFLFRPLPFPQTFQAGEALSLETISIAGLMACSILVVVLKDVLARLVALGATGILMCAFFTLRGAPDLALTGFLVEIVMFVVILLVLKQLKPEGEVTAPSRAWIPKALLAGAGGGILGLLVLFVLENPLAPSIHPYFIEASSKWAGGLNVVNVILVDFRGFDTMGEILVLALAGLGVFGLRRVWLVRPTLAPAPAEFTMRALPPSFLLSAVSRICLPVILIYSIYLTLKGHNYPGGGFIGGLVCAGGLVLEMLAAGRGRLLSQFPVNGRTLFGIGLALAFATGMGSVFLGHPFLTSAVSQTLHLSTAGIFDMGVYLVVVGVTLEMVALLGATEAPAGVE